MSELDDNRALFGLSSSGTDIYIVSDDPNR
jgi:hypothetical protein